MGYCWELPDMDFLLLDQVAAGYQPSCGPGFEGDIRFSNLWSWQQCSEAGATHLKKCQIYFLQGSSPKGCHLRWALAFREASWQVKSASPLFPGKEGWQSHYGKKHDYLKHKLTVITFCLCLPGVFWNGLMERCILACSGMAWKKGKEIV